MKPELSCRDCSFEGNNYRIEETNLHTQAYCPDCNSFIKNLSKKDKYGTKEQQDQIWEKTNGRCCFCGIILKPFKRNHKRGFTYEHMVPQSQGGAHSPENLYPSCKVCNSQKGNKTIEEYREYIRAKEEKVKHIFHFEVLDYSHLGELIKVIYG